MDSIEKVYEVIFNGEKTEEIYADMSKHQKKIFDKFRSDKESFCNCTLNDLIFEFDEEFYEMAISLELEEYLKECKKIGVKNKRNGSTKDIKIKIGDREILFNRPRLRSEKSFDSIIIPKRTRAVRDLQDNIILLYAKNNSIKDIKEILKGMCNINVSEGKISMLAQGIYEEVVEWRNRDISKCYFTLNIDCTYITIRDERYKSSHKIPIYIAIGTKLDGHKEIAGMYLGNEDENKNVIDELYDKNIGESKTYWIEVFNDLKDKGLEEVLFIVSDGLKGIEESIKMEFPNARYQRCIVHLDRNVSKLVSSKDQKEVMRDFKKLYIASNIEESMLRYNEFVEKYKNKKTLIRHVEEYYKYIKVLYNVPTNIRKYIYTNNIVESANSKVKRGFYGRGALPNVQSAINIVYLNLRDLEEKWAKKQVSNWGEIFKEINIFYKDTVNKYLK